MWNSNGTNEPLYKVKQPHRHRDRRVVACGVGVGVDEDALGGQTSRCRRVCIEWINRWILLCALGTVFNIW